MRINKYVFPLIVLVLSILCFSCNNKKEIAKKKPNYVTNGIQTMEPYHGKIKSLNPIEKSQLQASIEYFYNKYYIPNQFWGGFLVVKNGEIIYEKYSGMANILENKKIDSHTPLHIASLSKVLTATAILLLINSHKIDLDQKIRTILPDFPYPEITIKTLLNHRSGLRNYSYFTDKLGIWNKKDTLHNSDLIPVINKNNIALEYKTNTHFAYCNTNYAFLALIIEKVMQIPYSDAMKKLIFEPLDMQDTFVFNLKKDSKKVSNSFKGNKIVYPYNYLDAIYGDKNIYSTPRDLLKFDLATYNSNFLNKTLLDSVYKGYSYESRGIKNYGLGIRMLEWNNNKKLYYHNGWWHGNTAAYIKLKDEKVTLICLSNKYTKSTYALKSLSSLFGNYPYKCME